MNSETSRRTLFRAGFVSRLASLLGLAAPAAVPIPVRGSGPSVYQRFGVEPFINCTSTYTINGGSRQLPEVIAAVEQASHYHVNIDELMSKVGPRLAELLGAEAAIVSSGAAGAVTCGAAACIAGGDPEKMQKLPDITGMKRECVVPKWSRSYYDHAVRATGAPFLNVLVMGVFPQVMSRFIGLAVYQFDSNLRNSTMVGIVGGGGIGAPLFTAYQRFDYDVVLTILLVIIALIMLCELVSGRVRKVFQ